MLTIDFINVGYGDAILIQKTTGGQREFVMLVDCGDLNTGKAYPGSQRVTAAQFLRDQGINHLNLLVLTHLHLDHSGGLRHLLPGISIDEFWTNYLPPQEVWNRTLAVPDDLSSGARCLLHSMNTYLPALREMHRQGTRMSRISGTTRQIMLCENLQLDVFGEEPELYERQAQIWENQFSGAADGGRLDELDQFINNTSIRMRLTYRGSEVELPGDVYASCWEMQDVAPCTVVKLPHHGHRDSYTERLSEMLRPQYVVVSVSNMRVDDCPSGLAVELARRANAQLLFTDAVVRPGIVPAYHQAVRCMIDEQGNCAVNSYRAGGETTHEAV